VRRRANRGGIGWREVLFGLLLVAALCGVAWQARRPIQFAFSERQRAAQARREVRTEKKANADLARERTAIVSPGGRETKARDQGYLMPGEQLLNVRKSR
jgi:hypothetical protein